MPAVEPVEPSAADFIELDDVPSKPPFDPNHRLSDAELAEQDPERASEISKAKTMDRLEAMRRR